MEELNKEPNETRNLNFLEEIIEADLASGKCDSIIRGIVVAFVVVASVGLGFVV